MSTATLTNTDIRIRDAVMRQLEWDPRVDAGAVGVAASGGTVTLTGYIDTYAGKLAAERAAKRVHGVRAVANDIDVRVKLERTDSDVAKDVAHALELHSLIPDSVQASVHSGRVTLTGTVHWLFQKRDAEKAIRHVRGVRGVMNHVTVEQRAAERDVRRRVVQALPWNADVDARNIEVAIAGHRATLRGTVHSWLQHDAVERAVADAPGVTDVINQLKVESPHTEPPDEIC